ncbi:MAG: alpha-mannosidase [Oscillospiraceae bacterium]|nr:alpha-mannosidase [Oscillospiraceae bacterium]
MFFTVEKFKNRVVELGQRRYCNRSTIAPFVSMEDAATPDEWHRCIPQHIDGPMFGIGNRFEGRDRYLWLQKKILVPQSKEGMDVVGLFDFGETGDGHNSGFESLLYVNGHPYQGVDSNHKEVFFDGLEGAEVELTFLLWTGLEGGAQRRDFSHLCRQAEFALLHKKTDELYYFGRAITETLQYLDKNDSAYEPLMAAFDRALALIRWEEDEIFYPSVEAAHHMLMEGLSRMEKHTDVTLHAVGHTHIDVAWLWRLKHTREKAQRSFSTVLRLMERYDEYVFLQTQPQLYKFIQQDCPELFEKIRNKVAEGKWEADGGMWVEADCNLSSGESLVRQLLHGTRFVEKEFGKKCEYLWLPDVFGYSWALPQILRQCEIKTFMTTKISWNQYNTIPNDLFFWRGMDGSEILTYFIDTPYVNFKPGDRFSTYNGIMDPKTAIIGWQQFKNKELTHDTLMSYGYGDGGGGVNRDMLEMRRAMDQIPGCPNVVASRAGDFFKKMHSAVENTDRYVHTWDGELYLEYHRGTYTTQAYNKKTNRYLERRMLQLEWLSSVAYVLGGEYAQQRLHDSWECILLHQFHDIIPGSSIHEVYEDSRINYGKVIQTLDGVEQEVLASLQQECLDTYTIYSTNSFPGEEMVTVPEKRSGYFVDSNGNRLPSQTNPNGTLVLVQTQPFAGVEIRFVPDQPKPQDAWCQLGENALETPYYSLNWNENGQLTQVYDKSAGRQVLRAGQLGNVLEIYEDKPMMFDAWEIDIYHVEKMERITANAPAKLVECGDLRVVIQFTYSYGKSRIVQDMICYRYNKRIDFETWVDWHEDHKLLKTAFFTDIRSVKVSYDIQFGYVERPTHWNTSWDWARFEVCAHKWADFSETGYGVSLLNNCKYGHSIKDNVMRISLLKSSKDPDAEADMGEHTFTYSLYPHQGPVAAGGTIEEANRLNLPAAVVPGKSVHGAALFTVSSPNVQIDAIKKAEDEDCLVIRLHECRGTRAECTLQIHRPVKAVVPCNMLEHDIAPVMEGNSIPLCLGAFEIQNYKIYF